MLITEAVRGEGATLLDAAGRRFTDELAPRDAVTAAILDRIEADGVAERPARPPRARARALPQRLRLARRGRPRRRRPSRCLSPPPPTTRWAGSPIDLDGRSSLPGLFAVGECSCTGLHGANRLASNSLSECFVFGGRAGRAAARETFDGGRPTPPSAASTPRRRRPATPSGDSPGRCGARSSSRELLGRPLPARGRDRHRRPRARGVARRPPARRLSPLDPALDGIHIVIGPEGRTRRERVALRPAWVARMLLSGST